MQNTHALHELPRRDFIKGAAAVAVAGSLVPGAAAHADEVAPGAFWVPESWTDEADVIVIGYGGSGVNAAISAINEGASVIVLEKGDARGQCNMTYSSGTIHDCPGADVDEWVDRYVHGTFQAGLSADEIRPFLEEAAAVESWLPFEVTFTDQPTDGHTWPSFQREGQVGEGHGSGGFELFQKFDEVATGLNVDVRLSTPAKRLVWNPQTKEVLGVVAVDVDGNELAFKARKGVVMACGGYERNPRMFYQYNYAGIHLIGGGNPNATGDGFPMACAVGAQLWHMNEFHTGGMGFVRSSRESGHDQAPARGVLGRSATSPHIIVGPHGKRFMNESYISVHDMNHKAAWDFSTAWAFRKDVSESQDPNVAKYDARVSDYVNLPMFLVFDQTMYDAVNPLIGITATNEEAVEKGWLFKGDTLDELAAALCGERPCAHDDCMVSGVDAEALKETVATFNRYCADGYDPEFLRDAAGLMPLSETGPYYGVEVQWGMDFTEGGPKRNAKCQTIDVWDEPIGRLYNTGEFGSFNATPVYIVGGLLQAITTGRIAGREAAALEPWE